MQGFPPPRRVLDPPWPGVLTSCAGIVGVPRSRDTVFRGKERSEPRRLLLEGESDGNSGEFKQRREKTEMGRWAISDDVPASPGRSRPAWRRWRSLRAGWSAVRPRPAGSEPRPVPQRRERRAGELRRRRPGCRVGQRQRGFLELALRRGLLDPVSRHADGHPHRDADHTHPRLRHQALGQARARLPDERRPARAPCSIWARCGVDRSAEWGVRGLGDGIRVRHTRSELGRVSRAGSAHKLVRLAAAA